MLARIERKLGEIQRWVDSVYGISDVPAAIALAMYRTRPASKAHWIRVRPARLHGMTICMDVASMSDFVIYEEVFIDDVYDLDKVSFAPDAIIDCGAYHGYFSLMAAARFPGVPIIAFEPNAANLQILNRHVADNGGAIDVRASAVSTRDGSATFSGGGCGGRLDDNGGSGTEVQLTNLGRVVSESHCERLLLKLDIEGEEAAVLPDLVPRLPRRAAIFFEWHHDRETYQRAANLLSASGFIVNVTRENRLDDGTVYIDAFAQR